MRAFVKRYRVVLALAGVMIAAASALLGLATGLVWMVPVAVVGLPLLIAAVFIAWAVVMLAPVAVHEAGHLLAGWLVGFRFHAVRVGPVQAQHFGGRLRWQWTGRTFYQGGIAQMWPPDTARLIPRYRAYVLGGPVASLLLFLPLLACCVMPYVRRVQAGGAAIHPIPLMVVFAAYCGWLFMANLVPFRRRGHMSDGAKLLASASSRGARRIVLELTMAGIIHAGRRARHWPRDVLEEAAGLDHKVLPDLGLRILLYYRALDSGEREEAMRQVETAWELAQNATKWPAQQVGLARLETAYARAVLAGDPAGAWAAYRAAEGCTHDLEAQRLRALAAASAASGQYAEAVDAACLAEKELLRDVTAMTDAIHAELEWIRALKQESSCSGEKTSSVTSRME